MIDTAAMIAHIESLNNAGAIRFEPGIYIGERFNKYVPYIKTANMCSRPTAVMINSTSWGMFQMMGFNIYELYPKIKIGDFLNDAGLQHTAFHRFCKTRKIDFSMAELQNSKSARIMFAKVYNGDGIEYRKRMETYMTNQGLAYVD